MEALSELKNRGKYIIIQVLGDKKLVRHLSEMGMIAGKAVTVVSVSAESSGMVIFFQGQRLAISLDIAQRIVVRSVNESDPAKLKPLAEFKVGMSGIVRKMVGDRALRRRLMDMGLTNNTMIKINQVAPLGDPIELLVRGYKLSLRKADASCVLLEEV
ncbi:iron transporter FeoA [Secundilactobacillus paracollinoides]|uniref:Iron transporter FeoA n=1 Tax=Secundilactobacillus paracollinoides TaxID=240427 RepID=A0A1B2IVI0_9LACO|nr:ferrous iron transport protein A [Secundilactobacillus paracollinoides]ANZ60259.1 iron transporter FeoA [Secundilactobacillus paracollinoides]ANZ62784.1 iron transporter FeoA [Secundilactobacillus paracollinoides]ANZ66055.1 iron transporter FeoA [Secundilactobacillus paracollinoides]